MGFGFDRLGLRVPTLLISPWADGSTVVHDQFQGTSTIRTLRDWWRLGPALTPRDADAPSFVSVLGRTSPRPPREWPSVAPRALGVLGRAEQELLRRIEELDSPMETLERDLLGDALAHEARAGGIPVAADAAQVTHREAHEHFHRIGSKYFPGVAKGRQH
jgi:phospholipase C